MTFPEDSTANINSICKACDGAGVQTNIQTGIKVRCPACNGAGNWEAGKFVRPYTVCKSGSFKVNY
jgi:DnaJ-class molecular chaperone